MKRALLSVALLCSVLSSSPMLYSQSLTQFNEPTIGASQTMFLCDSFATTYPSITGMGITWDYFDIGYYPGAMLQVTVEDAALDSNYGYFQSATTTMNIANSLTTFFHTDSNGRISSGFVFSESTFGELIASYDVDNETLVSYPFSYGSSLSDVYEGMLEFEFNGVPQNVMATGNAYACIDGQGTLIQADGSIINDVIRYKFIDTTLTYVSGFGDVEIVRTQYEYYDLPVSNLPILMFSRVLIQQPSGGPAFLDNSIVLSLAQPTNVIGLTESNSVNFMVYPNPTEDKLKLQGDFYEDATVAILDQSGHLLMSLPATNGMSIDLSAFNTGMYLLKVTNNGTVTTKTVVKK